MIDRLGGIDPLKNVQNTHKTQRSGATGQPDSISVSAEAKGLSEVYNAIEVAAAAPDVRADRVAEVMEKMKNPSYINDSVVDMVANRIMDAYGL